MAFCALDGPYNIFIPGHVRVIRNKSVLTAKAWIMTFACPVTKILNLQVIETKSADSVDKKFEVWKAEQQEEKNAIENSKLKSEISLNQIKFEEIVTTKGTLEKHVHVIEADNLEHLKALNESQKKLEQLDEEKRSVLMELDRHLNEKKHIIKNMR